MDHDIRRAALSLAEASTLQGAAIGAAPSAERATLREGDAGAWTQRGTTPEDPGVPELGDEFVEVLPLREPEGEAAAAPTGAFRVELRFGTTG